MLPIRGWSWYQRTREISSRLCRKLLLTTYSITDEQLDRAESSTEGWVWWHTPRITAHLRGRGRRILFNANLSYIARPRLEKKRWKILQSAERSAPERSHWWSFPVLSPRPETMAQKLRWVIPLTVTPNGLLSTVCFSLPQLKPHLFGDLIPQRGMLPEGTQPIKEPSRPLWFLPPPN